MVVYRYFSLLVFISPNSSITIVLWIFISINILDYSCMVWKFQNITWCYAIPSYFHNIESTLHICVHVCYITLRYLFLIICHTTVDHLILPNHLQRLYPKNYSNSPAPATFSLKTFSSFPRSIYSLLLPLCILASSRRRIFPLGVFGIWSTNCTPPRSCL